MVHTLDSFVQSMLARTKDEFGEIGRTSVRTGFGYFWAIPTARRLSKAVPPYKSLSHHEKNGRLHGYELGASLLLMQAALLVGVVERHPDALLPLFTTNVLSVVYESRKKTEHAASTSAIHPY